MKQEIGVDGATGEHVVKTQEASKLGTGNASQTLVNVPESINKAGPATVNS